MTIQLEAVAQMVADLTTKSAMINMGEKIAWGSDSGAMDAAADMLTTLAAENATLRADKSAALARVKALADFLTDFAAEKFDALPMGHINHPAAEPDAATNAETVWAWQADALTLLQEQPK